MPQSRLIELMVYLDADLLLRFHLNLFLTVSICDFNTLYRLFGFTKDDAIPGYAFIPDGVGALMRFSDKTLTIFKAILLI